MLMLIFISTAFLRQHIFENRNAHMHTKLHLDALDNAVVKMHIDSLITIRYLQIDCLS